jgi:hypothetical protein
MRTGALYSAILHGVALAVLIFGLPWFAEPLNQSIVPVELVVLDTAETAKVKVEPKPEPEPEPKAEEKAPEPEPEQQQAKLEPAPAPPPAPEPEVKPAPEPVAEPPAPEAKQEPEPEPPPPPPEAKPEPKPKEAVKPPPLPKRRPEPKIAMPMPEKKEPEKKKEPPKPDRLTSILRNVEKMKDQPSPAPQAKAPKAPEAGPARPQVSAVQQNEMIRAIQQQVSRCWRLDPGAREAEDLIVEIRVQLNPDGSVRSADVVDVVRMVQDAYFRSAAENAKRAIDACSPFHLPLRQYDVWRDLTLRFNPREMFGT